MLMGGLFGRSVGIVCKDMGIPTSASNGVHAVVGSAAMLCGFKQMTLASVLIVVECVNDLSLAPVVMLAVTVSMAVNWNMNEHGYDEEVILAKKMPFLEGEAPPCLDGLVALDLCDPLPMYAILSPEATVDEVKQALREKQINYFPIRDGESGPCIGIVTRRHLKTMLDSKEEERAGGESSSPPESIAKFKYSRSAPDLMSLRSGAVVQDPATLALNMLPLHRLMDPTPFVVVEDMPAPRLYALFAKAGERASCVTSISGDLLGIISREGLIGAVRKQKLRREKNER
jgi:chloride channel 7